MRNIRHVTVPEKLIGSGLVQASDERAHGGLRVSYSLSSRINRVPVEWFGYCDPGGEMSEEQIKPLNRGMSWMLFIASGLVFTVGIQLFVLSEYTEHYFAWTVRSPLTAAFLGANYWAAFLLEYLSSREEQWDRARMAIPGVFVFTLLTILPTLIGLPYYHLNQFAFVWVAVYLIVPWVLGTLWFMQWRSPGVDGPRVAPLHPLMRGTLLIQGLSFLGMIGATIFSGGDWWPFPGESLYILVWLLAVAVVFLQAVYENCHLRLRSAYAGITCFGVFHLIAIARYSEFLDFDGTSAWVYVAFSAWLMVTGSVGSGLAWRAKQAELSPSTS